MYEEQVNLFSSWLHNIDASIADIHEVNVADIDSALKKLYLFEQEHAEKKSTIQNVRDKFNAALGGDTSAENPAVAQYKDVIEKYEVDTDLESTYETHYMRTSTNIHNRFRRV